MDNEAETPSCEEYKTTPLKKYVTVVGNKKDGKWVCTFGCKEDPYTGSYNRIRAHLLGIKPGEKSQGIVKCNKVSVEERRSMQQEEEDARELYGGPIRKRSKPDAPTVPTGNKYDGGSHSVKGMFNMATREDTDTKVARFFYGCGISFNVARSPLWIDAVKAINESPRGYRAPGSEKIRTTLLDKEKTNVEGKLMIVKQDWPLYGVSIVSDGWSNIRSQPLLNVLAVCGGKP